MRSALGVHSGRGVVDDIVVLQSLNSLSARNLDSFDEEFPGEIADAGIACRVSRSRGLERGSIGEAATAPHSGADDARAGDQASISVRFVPWVRCALI